MSWHTWSDQTSPCPRMYEHHIATSTSLWPRRRCNGFLRFGSCFSNNLGSSLDLSWHSPWDTPWDCDVWKWRHLCCESKTHHLVTVSSGLNCLKDVLISAQKSSQPQHKTTRRVPDQKNDRVGISEYMDLPVSFPTDCYQPRRIFGDPTLEFLRPVPLHSVHFKVERVTWSNLETPTTRTGGALHHGFPMFPICRNVTKQKSDERSWYDFKL